MVTKLSTQLQIGDLVILKRMTYKVIHKIQDHWERKIYKIEGQQYTGTPFS